MFKKTRDYFLVSLPEAVRAHHIETEGIEVYFAPHPTNSSYVVAMAFYGKAAKPAFYLAYKDAAKRQAAVDKWLEDKAAAAKQKIEARQKAKAELANHNVKAGDIFVSSWGYEQTNVDYFQVISTTGAMATIRQISAQKTEHEGYMSGTSVPAPNRFKGEEMRKKISVYDGQPRLTISSFQSASRLDPLAEVAGVKIYPAQSWTSYA